MAASSTRAEAHRTTADITADEWFLTGFTDQVGLTVDDLRRTGTTVAPRPDRSGTGVVAVYHTVADNFDHTVLWTDPANTEPLDLGRFERPTTTAIDDLHPPLVAAGGEFLAKATMRVPIDRSRFTELGERPPGAVTLRWADLDAANPDDLDLIRRFTSGIDPAEVEQAALDDLDDFYADEIINVLTDPDTGDIVAYGAAAVWDWDTTVVDVGVLVAPSHRTMGLGRAVVARVCATIVNSGRLPLYRHERANAGSGALADRLGFRSVVDLAVYRFEPTGQ